MTGPLRQSVTLSTSSTSTHVSEASPKRWHAIGRRGRGLRIALRVRRAPRTVSFGERLVGEDVGEFEAAVAARANGGEVTVVDERNDGGSTEAKNSAASLVLSMSGTVTCTAAPVENARRTSAIAATTSGANTALPAGVVRATCWPSPMAFSTRWSGSVCLGGTRISEMLMSRPYR
jgi:hypothetical protein